MRYDFSDVPVSIPVSIVTTTTLQMTMANMIKFLRQGGAQLPEHGQVRLESVVDDDNVGDQIVTMSWREDRKER